MSVTYQDINEALASNTPNSEIKKADSYLKSGKGNKPEWLDEFLASNEYKLKETILRAISSAEGITSVSGYREGYFNEIIQNANDLHAGERIEIRVSKEDTVYSVKCFYQDKGFTLSNIYGFLNREMSDKSSAEGQTGKFGVGIKAFFKFVKWFRIESNVIFDFAINRTTHTVDSTVSVNDQWDQKTTILSFSYDQTEAESSGFNLKKLSGLIDYLNGDSSADADVARFMISGEDEELVFDIRSMIFMNQNPDKTAISELKIAGNSHSLSVICKDACDVQEIETESDTWTIRKVDLNITLDNEEYDENEYIVFRHGKTTIGFPLSDELNGYNRFYATYYIKTDSVQKMLPIGLIINTLSANMHRNDLGDSEKEIDEAYDKIRKKILSLYTFMCSEQIASAVCLNEISRIFHSVLYKYLDEDREKYEESPFNIECLDNQYLPKIAGDTKSDIVVHKKIENYQKSTPSDADDVPALTAMYFEVIERSNVIDFTQFAGTFLDGVSQLYQQVSLGNDSENYKTARKILHYYPSVAEYISYVVSGEYREDAVLSDNEIDRWLIHLKQEQGEAYNQFLCLKLIGRYQLNPALRFDGSLIKENLSFKDYLFNGIPELKDGCLSNWQNEQYDFMYAELKQQLLGNRLQDLGNTYKPYMIRYIEPSGPSRRRWDGTYDCYYEDFPCESCSVSEENKYLLLEKIASDSNIKSVIYLRKMRLLLFERRPVLMRCRDKFFAHYNTYEQQIICIDFLKSIQLSDFGNFLRAVDYLKQIKEFFWAANIKISCRQLKLSTSDIANTFLPKLVGLNEDTYSPTDVLIGDVEENTNNELPQENIDFIFNISGYNLHVCRFDSGSKKYVIAYFGNQSAKIKMEARASFKPIASYRSNSKDIYIFYDNVPDINAVVSCVLKELNLSKNLMDFLLGYIHNGNDTKTMNYLSRRRTFARVKKKLILDWADLTSDAVSEMDDVEIIYRLLTARGSYDIYCPICADIPLETFDYGEDTKKKHSRRIIVLENENRDTKQDFPYIITVACSYCFEKLLHTLSKSEFDGKRITLTTQIAQGQHEKMRSRHQFELSPVNIMLMKNIRLGKMDS